MNEIAIVVDGATILGNDYVTDHIMKDELEDAPPAVLHTHQDPYEDIYATGFEAVDPRWLVPVGEGAYREMYLAEVLEHVIVDNF